MKKLIKATKLLNSTYDLQKAIIQEQTQFDRLLESYKNHEEKEVILLFGHDKEKVIAPPETLRNIFLTIQEHYVDKLEEYQCDINALILEIQDEIKQYCKCD